MNLNTLKTVYNLKQRRYIISKKKYIFANTNCVVCWTKTVASRFPSPICKKDLYADDPFAQRRRSCSGGELPLTHRLAVIGSRVLPVKPRPPHRPPARQHVSRTRSSTPLATTATRTSSQQALLSSRILRATSYQSIATAVLVASRSRPPAGMAARRSP
jgi:hypothetical protein